MISATLFWISCILYVIVGVNLLIDKRQYVNFLFAFISVKVLFAFLRYIQMNVEHGDFVDVFALQTRFLLGPMLYFAFKFYFSHTVRYRSVLVHLIPFILLFTIYFFTLSNYEYKILIGLSLLHTMVYFTMWLNTAFKLFRLIKDKLDLSYFYVSYVCMALFIILRLFTFVIKVDIEQHLFQVFVAYICLDSFLLLFVVFNNKYVVVNYNLPSNKVDLLSKLISDTRIYTNSSLSPQEIITFLSKDKPDLLVSLSKDDLLYLYEYVYRLRVSEFKALIASSLHSKSGINLTDVAFKSGFNSRSTFNRHFKKVEGITPIEFVNQAFKNESS